MVSHTVAEDVLTVNLKGEIDHHSVADFRSEIDALIGRYAPIKTVLDFGSVTFCDSSGIALVVGRYKKMADHGGILELAKVPRKIGVIFSMAGIDRMVPMTEQEKRT